MTSEKTVFVRNVLIYRVVVYAVAVSATFSILILSLGYFLGKNMFIGGFGALLAWTPVLVMFLVARKLPIGFEVNAEGIHVVFRKQRKQLILWKDVISFKLVNKDLDRYVLRFLKDDGQMAWWGLSREPAEKVMEMWSKLFPDGRDISDDTHSEFPTG
jgi:hypothetical protein